MVAIIFYIIRKGGRKLAMENVNETLLATYLYETNTLLSELDELLLRAEQEGDFSVDDVNAIFRTMHTIKGSSAMMEFQPLMELSHHIEDLFFEIRENGTGIFNEDQKGVLFNLLFKCTDRLCQDIEKVEASESLVNDIEPLIKEIDSLLHEVKGGGSVPASKSSASEEEHSIDPNFTSDYPFYLHILFDEDCGMENVRALIVTNALKELSVDLAIYPSDIDSNSDTATFIASEGFFIGIKTEEDVELSIGALSSISNMRSYEVVANPAFLALQDELTGQTQSKIIEETKPKEEVKKEEPVKAPEPTKKPKPTGDTNDISNQIKNINQSKQSLISVKLEKLDNLMAIVGEIVITESMVAASPELEGLKLDAFLKSTRSLRKLTDDLQDIVMSLRMVPVSGVFQKMNRIVRDMSKALNKDVKLTIIGEETEVDKTIVDSIGDPIMHIVRNAMDHGIEKTQEERIAAGKNPQGEIILSAKNTGSEVIIQIENDGADINTEAILSKAERKGLLSKSPSDYTEHEIVNFLTMAGFSTNSEVTEYSGRGVGLDVVKKNVESIGGNVTITNNKGENFCVTLKIPLTLAIVSGMEIACGDEIFTLPINNIRQSFIAKNEDIILDVENNELISYMGNFYPIIRLNNTYGIKNSATSLEDGILIWVDSSTRSYCLFVDKLIGEQQVVVKPLPSYLNNFDIKRSGVSGCTILGNGNISLILDVESLFSSAKLKKEEVGGN